MAQTLKIDIHGMFVEDALEMVRQCIARAPRGTERIIVVHGHNRGTALQEAIRHRLHAPRILQIEGRFLNDGETIIWLK